MDGRSQVSEISTPRAIVDPRQQGIDLGSGAAGFGLPELVPVRVEADPRQVRGGRLNLIIPIIAEQWIFGGIATALRLSDKLARHFGYVRIVVLYQSESQFDFEQWSQWTVDRGALPRRSLIFLADQAAQLLLSDEDYFVATLWSTATYTKLVLARQSQLFARTRRRFVYLIQDYEPGFYPWSIRHVSARSTYEDRDRAIAIFNSQLLAQYFNNNGLLFPEHYVFEPLLHPRLRQGKVESAARPKDRMILVYGRPSMPRNAFDLIVEALRDWAASYPGAADWTAVSAGEAHEVIRLNEGGTITLQAGGKLTLDEYVDHLSRCWIGVSFMISPHPSYPPLEMAEFGAWVITNGFEGKDLSKRAANIISVDALTPAEVASRISWCCEQYKPDRTSAIDERAPVFCSAEDEFPFLDALVESWRLDG